MLATCLVFVLVALSSSVSAFHDLQPLVAWSSLKTAALNTLTPSTLDRTRFSLGKLSDAAGLCDHDLVVIISQHGLHASDLRSSPLSIHVSQELEHASSAFQLPYVRLSELTLLEFTESVSARCGSRIHRSSLAEVPGLAAETGMKYVLRLDLPASESTQELRASGLSRRDTELSRALEGLTNAFSKHLVILTGTPFARERRLEPSESLFDSLVSPSPKLSIAAPNSTLPDGGILKQYQLLTPALITTLLVAFFLMVPTIMLGVYALASIQTPSRMEPPKKFNAQEKKVQ